jgi:hypothetical protein
LIPGGAGVLRNGQFDAQMWALIAIGAAEIAIGRYWSAALILSVALAIKPTAIVHVLLMGALWPSVGARLLPFVLAILVLPFLFADHNFVWRLYFGLFARIGGAVQQPGQWNNMANAFAHFDMPISFTTMTMVGILAALATLAIGWTSRRRLPRPFAAFSIFSLATIYLLLFNPRTEGTGYIGLALVAAPLASRMLLLEERRCIGAILIAVCVTLGVTGLTPLTLQILGIWLKPSLALLTAIFVIIPRALDLRLWPRTATASSRETLS